MIQKLNSTYRYNISNQNHKTKESSSIFLNPFIPKISSLSFHFIPRIFECLEIASLFFPSLLPIPHTKRCRCFCSIGQEFCWKNSVTNQWVFPATHIYIRGIHPSTRSMDPHVFEITRFAKPRSKRDLRFHGSEFMAATGSNWIFSSLSPTLFDSRAGLAFYERRKKSVESDWWPEYYSLSLGTREIKINIRYID